MELIELVLDQLLSVEDVIPFRLLSRAVKFLADRRVCEIFLKMSHCKQENDYAELGTLLQDVYLYKGEKFLGNGEFVGQANKVVFSDDGWKVRFENDHSNSSKPYDSGATLQLSIRALMGCLRESLWYARYKDLDLEMFGWNLEGGSECWRSNESVTGPVICKFASGSSICYQVDAVQGPAQGSSNDTSRISNNNGRVTEPQNPKFVHRFMYFDVPISQLLEVWSDWKTPVQPSQEYLDKYWKSPRFRGRTRDERDGDGCAASIPPWA
jgi:hypothetical protein